MTDLMIIGTGPAGISAALTAKARKLDFLWFGDEHLSDKIKKAEKINNYPGLISVTGKQMQEIFLNQINDANINIISEKIDSIYPLGKYFAASVKDKIYEAKAVILAIGMTTEKPLQGEEKFLGRGVSYCATCDGNFYKQKNIAVICTNSKYEEEVDYLAGIANKVYLYKTYKESSLKRDNVIIENGMPQGIEGTNRVEEIILKDSRLSVDGVFILRDNVSPGILLRGLSVEKQHIITQKDMSTNIPGCFAAGDCTGRPYQYTKAAGEGNVAVHSVISYLQELSL